jgi:hypothetical protein
MLRSSRPARESTRAGSDEEGHPEMSTPRFLPGQPAAYHRNRAAAHGACAASKVRDAAKPIIRGTLLQATLAVGAREHARLAARHAIAALPPVPDLSGLAVAECDCPTCDGSGEHHDGAFCATCSGHRRVLAVVDDAGDFSRFLTSAEDAVRRGAYRVIC